MVTLTDEKYLKLKELIDKDPEILFVYSHASIPTYIDEDDEKREPQLYKLTVPDNINIVDVTPSACDVNTMSGDKDFDIIECIREYGLMSFLDKNYSESKTESDTEEGEIKRGGAIKESEEKISTEERRLRKKKRKMEIEELESAKRKKSDPIINKCNYRNFEDSQYLHYYWTEAKIYYPGDEYFNLRLSFAVQDIRVPKHKMYFKEDKGLWGIYNINGYKIADDKLREEMTRQITGTEKVYPLRKLKETDKVYLWKKTHDFFLLEEFLTRFNPKKTYVIFFISCRVLEGHTRYNEQILRESDAIERFGKKNLPPAYNFYGHTDAKNFYEYMIGYKTGQSKLINKKKDEEERYLKFLKQFEHPYFASPSSPAFTNKKRKTKKKHKKKTRVKRKHKKKTKRKYKKRNIKK